MTSDELRKEIQKKMPQLKIAQDVVSPELLSMSTKKDILDMPGPRLTALLYRSDGSKRRANEARINELLQN
jgi:hypothetical protein